MTYVLLILAGVIWLWPRSVAPAGPTLQYTPSPAELKPPALPQPSYHSSLMALSTVRQRLVQTESLDETCRKSIDSLVLALVAGSDQP